MGLEIKLKINLITNLKKQKYEQLNHLQNYFNLLQLRNLRDAD